MNHILGLRKCEEAKSFMLIYGGEAIGDGIPNGVSAISNRVHRGPSQPPLGGSFVTPLALWKPQGTLPSVPLFGLNEVSGYPSTQPL